MRSDDNPIPEGLMRIWADGWRITAMALGLALVGCAPGERAAEATDEAPAAEAAVADEDAAVPEEEETAAAAEPQAGTPEVAVPDAAAEGPGAVAPAEEGEARVMRNWVLLEFSRPVEEADLEWLEANGFRVDSVMSELRVRGWLERSEDGRVIASDPRIARVHTQMR
jgi:hypothetical protein